LSDIVKLNAQQTGVNMKLVSHILKPGLTTAALGCLLLGVAPLSAVAATNTTTFAVTATVQATCLVSATPMAFGTYTGSAATSTSTISVTCTNTTPYNVGLNAGTATGATVTARKMSGPNSAVLAYSLTSDSAHSVNWGQTVGTDTVAGSGNGSAQALTVYGQVAGGQYVNPGAYADTITATVTY
jgi:spore coat protein U-like protein